MRFASARALPTPWALLVESTGSMVMAAVRGKILAARRARVRVLADD
ncbi:MAG TPA: hypothetical protein VK966_03125 [Longimicrobiales bacterium]|nr:hypothetical protein [Longimicrobiales bacterium]